MRDDTPTTEDLLAYKDKLERIRDRVCGGEEITRPMLIDFFATASDAFAAFLERMGETVDEGNRLISECDDALKRVEALEEDDEEKFHMPNGAVLNRKEFDDSGMGTP